MKMFEFCLVVVLTGLLVITGTGFYKTVKHQDSPAKVVALDHNTVVKSSSIAATGKMLEVSVITEEELLLKFTGDAISVLAQLDQFILEATKGKDVAQYTSQVYSFLNCRAYTFIDTDSGTRYLTGASDSRYNFPQGTPLAKIKEAVQSCISEEKAPVVGLNWEGYTYHQPEGEVGKGETGKGETAKAKIIQ